MAARKAGVLIAGTGVYATAVYMTYTYLQMSKGCDDFDSDQCYTASPVRTQQFQKIASEYDARIDKDEFFMGIGWLRRWLIRSHAIGDVLEVGAGTGRNLTHYTKTPAVKRVILSDASDQMLHQARQKIAALDKPQDFAVVQADASNLSFAPSGAFDTVVDTFGLCSFEDPVAVLREMARVCKPSGKILLLEHGRSHSWDFVTKHLDRYAERHAADWGCVWNRDLDAILTESGLEIEVLWRWHFGTTYYVVCRPKKGD